MLYMLFLTEKIPDFRDVWKLWNFSPKFLLWTPPYVPDIIFEGQLQTGPITKIPSGTQNVGKSYLFFCNRFIFTCSSISTFSTILLACLLKMSSLAYLVKMSAVLSSDRINNIFNISSSIYSFTKCVLLSICFAR